MTHYIRRSLQVGLKNTVKIVASRMYAYGFDLLWRSKATRHKARHEWDHLVKNYNAPLWQDFVAGLRQQSLYSIDRLYIQKDLLLSEASACKDGYIATLGSPKIHYAHHWPWHTDIRLSPEGALHARYNPHLYYKDINASKSHGFEPGKDIKVPWELGRLHHLSLLAAAYVYTKDSVYATRAKEIWRDFAQHNPFLLGVNWACPMDVGIRAANMVWAAHHLMDDDHDFWQHYASAIYDHLFYLEHNWEVYDGVTSNHYVADLIGYLYCCWFFQSLPGMRERIEWCCKELVQEFEKQVFHEGTDYEGSSSYHRMVTEFFYHFSFLATALGYTLADEFHKKLERMLQFAQITTFDTGEWMQIGDNDSGRLLFGLTPGFLKKALLSTSYIKRYEEFGLTVGRQEGWHYSLRHARYASRQPSGHFHQDAGSVTFAYQGIPIIIDPGTYLYTPSVSWRNYFRAQGAHSLMSVKKSAPESLDDRLFMLDMPYEKNELFSDAQGLAYVSCDSHISRRHIFIKNGSLCIEDAWLQAPQERVITSWRFIVHPAITPKIENEKIVLWYQNSPIMYLESDLAWTLYETWYSPGYGIKMPTYGLYAESLMPVDCKQTFICKAFGQP